MHRSMLLSTIQTKFERVAPTLYNRHPALSDADDQNYVGSEGRLITDIPHQRPGTPHSKPAY